MSNRKQRAFAAWAERSEQCFIEQAERDPWIHEYRAVKAEVERTGDDSLFADFERRFIADMRKRYGSPR